MTNSSNQEHIKKITNLADEFLKKMTFDNFKITSSSSNDIDGETIFINIETEESNLLIGQYGVTLRALQHILRVMTRKIIKEKIHFIVDVNGYLRQKKDSLLEIAHEAAKQAIDERKPVVLRPMSAYERRIVHLELSENENVKTESMGEGDERKIIVRPIGDLEKLEEQRNSFQS